MTSAQAVAALIRMMPEPISVAQLDEYGVIASDADVQTISREILSLNLYWILAAVDAHIPFKYRAGIIDALLESIKSAWWETGKIGPGAWDDYRMESEERRVEYGRLVDQEGMNPTAVSAAAASWIEDQGGVSQEDRSKLLVLLIDCAPASEYGKLLEEAV